MERWRERGAGGEGGRQVEKGGKEGKRGRKREGRGKGSRPPDDQKKNFKAKFKWFGLKYPDPSGITLLKRVVAAATKTLEETVFSSPRMGALCKLSFRF